MEHKFLFGEKLAQGYLNVVDKIARPFISLGISPNFFTVIGLAFAIITGLAFYKGYILWGGILLWVSGFFDNLDGVVARKSDKATSFGALLDSTLDRYGEFFVYIGLWAYFRNSHTFGTHVCELLILLIILGSYIVSYVRARAEGLGLSCSIGVFQRGERVFILGLGALISGVFNPLATRIEYTYLTNIFLKLAIFILAIGSNYTALERIFYIKDNAEDISVHKYR
ncbi:CDP-alcohol phosphatidyltransferase family protein [bacterium]|nr:CDP-alcohol phosphatidyltransferase family protein [bacterium]